MIGLYVLVDSLIPRDSYLVDARLLLVVPAAFGWLAFERKSWRKHK